MPGGTDGGVEHDRRAVRRLTGRRVDRYPGGSDDLSMEDATSAFDCRALPASSRWSWHAYGRAIAVSPRLNPYLHRRGLMQPSDAGPYLDRGRRDPGLLHTDDPAVRAFIDRGWRWGGAWRSPVDYQLFERRRGRDPCSGMSGRFGRRPPISSTTTLTKEAAMAEAGFWVAWGIPARGRERQALDLLKQTTTGYLDRLVTDGVIERFDTAVLKPQTTELGGFILIQGSRQQLDALRRDHDFQRWVAQVQLVADRVGIVDAWVNQGLDEAYGLYEEALTQLD